MSAGSSAEVPGEQEVQSSPTHPAESWPRGHRAKEQPPTRGTHLGCVDVTLRDAGYGGLGEQLHLMSSEGGAIFPDFP